MVRRISVERNIECLSTTSQTILAFIPANYGIKLSIPCHFRQINTLHALAVDLVSQVVEYE